MASFDDAVAKTLHEEGGSEFTETVGDKGGATKYGISQRAYPGLDIKNLTEKDAREIYRRDYWDHLRGDEILSQVIAESIFDFAVNVGVTTATKIAQKTIGLLNVDGKLGINTLSRINSATTNPESFTARYTILKIAYYATICNKDKTQTKFLLGWINRALGVQQ